ncbi:MAG: hypothetical protein PWP65_1474 [Clostridia bacterium]|nr:hypothetical protein [Clostridia bacterium]
MVHVDGTLVWQSHLRGLSDCQLKLDGRGLKFLSPLDLFERAGEQLAKLPAGLTFLGSGSFHHLSYHLIKRHADQPITLIVFDSHADFYPAPEGYVSCGSWLAKVMDLAAVQKVILIGKAEGIPLSPKVLPVSYPPDLSLAGLIPVRRIYVSIDKDVLKEAATDWGRGPIPLPYLLGCLNWLRHRYELVGADVCGELVPRSIWPDANELRQIKINERINLGIYRALVGLKKKSARRLSA